MPISGPLVHQQLMSAYAEAQKRLEDARGRIVHEKTRRDDLEGSRGDALVTLAEHYLPELTRDAIQDTWFEIRASVSEILLRKEDHARRLDERVAELTSQRLSHESELLKTNEKLDQARQIQDDVAEQVEDQLRGDRHFIELSDRAAIAEAALERAEDNLEEITKDSDTKLPNYEQSELFKYLHDCGYGTPAYSKRGLTRRMDRWVARMIGYAKAKQGYDFLKNTPEAMKTIIIQDRASFDTVMDELERIRDEVAADVGLPARIELTVLMETERQAKLMALEELNETTQSTQHELTDLEDTRGTYYRQAVTLFRGMLQQSDPRELRQRARQTPTLTDDQIVARLSGIDAEILDLEDVALERQRRIRRMQVLLDGLGRMTQRFRAAGFDAGRCQFSESLDVMGRLARADDDNDLEDLWMDIRRAQRWGPSTMDKITRVATHPMTQVLINAMAHAAGAALQGNARRAGYRRSSGRRRW